MNWHRQPFEEEHVDDRRSLQIRCNDLASTVRDRDQKIEQLEHQIADLRFKLDVKPKRKRARRN